MATNVQPTPWTTESSPPLRLLAVLLAIPVLAIVAFTVFQPIQVLPRISLAPGFAFTDQNGDRLTSEDLRGRLTLYTFTYTRCAAPCPQPSRTLHALQPALATVDAGAIPLEYVVISFDPDYDTPARLAAHAQALGTDTAAWHFVTGEPSQLKNVIGGGFGVYYSQEAPGNFTFDPVFALVDGWGILRAVYRTPTPDPEILARDVRLIVQETRNSEGINRYAYEAAHLFSCYPR
jgi:protein SCO1/2